MTTIRPMQENEAEAVRALWQAACVEAVGHELAPTEANQVLINLRQYAVHERCHCFVAEQDAEIIGFVTCCARTHPIEPGMLGEIEELYVQQDADRAAVSAALIARAVARLKLHGAGMITTRVAVDDPETIALWHGLKWEQDTVNFNIYGNVPGDPVSQAVWDSYAT